MTGRWLSTIIITTTILVIKLVHTLFPGSLPDFLLWEPFSVILTACIPLAILSGWIGVVKTIGIIVIMMGTACVMYVLTVAPV